MEKICVCGKKLNFRNGWRTTCKCGRKWGLGAKGKIWQFVSRPTKHAPDVVESAASSEISTASEVSASEADSSPATTQVM